MRAVRRSDPDLADVGIVRSLVESDHPTILLHSKARFIRLTVTPNSAEVPALCESP
jgi:hypothetical protein